MHLYLLNLGFHLHPNFLLKPRQYQNYHLFPSHKDYQFLLRKYLLDLNCFALYSIFHITLILFVLALKSVFEFLHFLTLWFYSLYGFLFFEYFWKSIYSFLMDYYFVYLNLKVPKISSISFIFFAFSLLSISFSLIDLKCFSFILLFAGQFFIIWIIIYSV